MPRDPLRVKLIKAVQRARSNSVRIKKMRSQLKKLVGEEDVKLDNFIDKGPTLGTLTEATTKEMLHELSTCVNKTDVHELIHSFADLSEYTQLRDALVKVKLGKDPKKRNSMKKLKETNIPTLLAVTLVIEVLNTCVAQSPAVQSSMEFLNDAARDTNDKNQPVIWNLDEVVESLPALVEDLEYAHDSLEAYADLESDIKRVQTRLATLTDDVCGSAQPYQMSMLHAYFTIMRSRKQCEAALPKLFESDKLTDWTDLSRPASMLYTLDYCHNSLKESFKRFERTFMLLRDYMKEAKEREQMFNKEITAFMVESRSRFKALEMMCERNQLGAEQLQAFVRKEILLLNHNHAAILKHLQQYQKRHREVLAGFSAISDYDIENEAAASFKLLTHPSRLRTKSRR